MPLLGAHMSIAGGLHLAFRRIVEVQGEALQIFTRNERQWQVPPLSEEAVSLFHEQHRETGFMPVAAHDSYLINLAAVDPTTLEKSVVGFAAELQRAELLRIPYLIMHPGSHGGMGVEEGLEHFVDNLDRAMALSECSNVTVLLETTAGQGTNLGSRFEELAAILRASDFRHCLGICYDTCHTFAAGYDLRTREAYARTFSHFDETVGLENLKFFHLNDSRKGLGSHVDRHEHIGRGEIGLEAFRLLLNDPRFSDHPMVLETPKGKDLREDRENLAVLRSLIESGILF